MVSRPERKYHYGYVCNYRRAPAAGHPTQCPRLEKTIDYADAAVRGGVAFFEVALNSPHALEQITMLRKHFGDRCLVGGGTAITTERCRTAVDAGAQFLLTPGTPVDVLEYCAKNDIALLPGRADPHRCGRQPGVWL